MVEPTELTKEELTKIITEELGELDEGLLARMMAKITGVGKGAKVKAANVAKKVGNKVVQALEGEPAWKEMDPRLQKELTVLMKRFGDIGRKNGKLDKIGNDIWNDFAKLSKNMDDAVREPLEPVIMDAITQFREGLTGLAGLGNVIQKQLAQAEKGSGVGTAGERLASKEKGEAETKAAQASGQPAMAAESRNRKKNIKLKILKANKK